MVATMADLANLEMLRSQIEVVGDDTRLVVDDSLDSDTWGENDGKGTAKVSSQARLRRMGIPDEYVTDVQRGVGFNEMVPHGFDKEVVHDGGREFFRAVSGSDTDHRAAHERATDLLDEIDPAAAYAVRRYILGAGDGGNEFSALRDRTYGKAGALSGGDKEESFLDIITDVYRTIVGDIVKEYALLNDPLENIAGYVKNGVVAEFWSAVVKVAGQNSAVGSIAEGFRGSAAKRKKNHAEAISPIATTYDIGSSGLTDIFKVYAFIDGQGQKWPLFYTTFDKTDPPNEEKLLDGIRYYEREGVSPMKDARAATQEVISKKFKQWRMKNFIGEDGYGLISQEPQRTNARISMISTMENGGIWNRDYNAEAALPASCQGKVQVFSTKRRSFAKFMQYFGNDMGLNLASAILYAPVAASLRSVGFGDGEVYLRDYFNDTVMPYGTERLSPMLGGGNRFFTYKKAA